jgi:hypothetical protein
MTEQELEQQRREKWRVNGAENAIRTLEDAAQFIASVGFCLMYPVRPPVLAPTFMGAFAGEDRDLPARRHAFRDPRAAEATGLMVRLLRQRSAFETNLLGETSLLLSAEIYPYFYALIGDRNPKQALTKSPRGNQISPLTQEVFAALREHGPLSKPRLAERLGGSLSASALERALNELWSRLRITRVDYQPEEGAFWDVLYRWAPQAVSQGTQLSLVEALSALLSKYLDCVVAAEPEEIEDFFQPMASRSRVRDAVNAMLGAREFDYFQVGRKTLLRITPPVAERRMPPRQRATS